MYFFLTINLLLSLLAIFLFLIMYKKISKIQQLEEEYKALLKEAEDTISSYVYELKEENEHFIKEFERRKRSGDSIPNVSSQSINIVEEPLVKEDVNELLNEQEDINELISDHNEEVVPNLAQVEKSPYELALVLHESGVSTEQIAQRLNLGKTEVELLLKFRQ
ncbi:MULTISPECIES: DUF2802 domain-containing protein [Bacillus]|uniref:DUF2802 domain-containing protein n=1 Tax=Bacillus TaxID=1386 RepID=UPI0011450EAC|nr:MULTISPECIES: DUF2802 domain-containing protein [Bacillus]